VRLCGPRLWTCRNQKKRTFFLYGKSRRRQPDESGAPSAPPDHDAGGVDQWVALTMWAWMNFANLLAVLRGGGAGMMAGFVSGLLGVSPGGILVPAVCLVLGVDQHVAQGISLVAQIPPTGLNGVSEYRRRGQAVPVEWVVALSLGFIVGGAFGAIGARGLSDHALRWSFVGYLMVLAAIAALRSRRSPSSMPEQPVTAHWAALVAIGVAAGLSSGVLGIGGGLAVTALSTTLLRLGQHRAQAMSLILTLLPLTIPAALVYLTQGWAMPWWSIAGVVAGLWIATAIGARVANRLPERLLRPTFIVLILGMAAYMATRSPQ
jgi:uncharacterized protein